MQAQTQQSLQVQQSFRIACDVVGGVVDTGGTLWLSLVTEGKGSLARVDKATGEVLRQVETQTVSGLTFDGTHLWGVTREGIQCIDKDTLAVVRTLPRPEVEGFLSGLAWDGEALWLGGFEDKKIFKMDRETGRVLRTIESDRYVTGITWVGDELWHATAPEENGELGDLRRISQETGAVIEKHPVPYMVSGLHFDGQAFLCGDCDTGTLRIVRRTDA